MNNTTHTETGAVKAAREDVVQPYTLYKRSYINDNTAQYGFGDFPETIISSVLSIHAKSLRSAQNHFKKVFGKRMTFSGKFATYFVRQVGGDVI